VPSCVGDASGTFVVLMTEAGATPSPSCSTVRGTKGAGEGMTRPYKCDFQKRVRYPPLKIVFLAAKTWGGYNVYP